MHLHVARRFPSSLPQIVCRRVNGMPERHRRLGLELLSARVGGTTKLARTQRRKAPVSLTADELEPKIRWRRPDLFGAGQKPIGSGTHLDSFVDLISPAVEALPAGHSTNNAIAAERVLTGPSNPVGKLHDCYLDCCWGRGHRKWRVRMAGGRVTWL